MMAVYSVEGMRDIVQLLRVMLKDRVPLGNRDENYVHSLSAGMRDA